MAQIIRITSEALQSTIRRLLPSQQGFGEDLQASNVITPIIDLTPSAEGGSLGTSLQQALAYGSQTVFDVGNATSTIANVAGFYRVVGTYVLRGEAKGGTYCRFQLTDGSVTKKIILEWQTFNTGVDSTLNMGEYDFIVYLRSNDTLEAEGNTSIVNLTGSVRQIADVNGVLVDPSGFSPQ